MPTDAPCPLYPPVAVAVALAARSHAIAGSAPAIRARLAFVVRLGEAAGWSDATRAAHAMLEIDWLAIARHLGEPIDRLQRLDPVVLLARVSCHSDQAKPGIGRTGGRARSA